MEVTVKRLDHGDFGSEAVIEVETDLPEYVIQFDIAQDGRETEISLAIIDPDNRGYPQVKVLATKTFKLKELIG
jgi:hypothetical protein